MWHDTTMWNEGFELAREPLVTVVVGHSQEAHQLMNLVSASNEVNNRAFAWDRLFEVRTHPTEDPELSWDNARRRVQRAMDEWEGV